MVSLVMIGKNKSKKELCNKRKIWERLDNKQISWFSILHLSIAVALFLSVIFIIPSSLYMGKELRDLQEKVELLEARENSATDFQEYKLAEYINKMDEKADSAVDRTVAIISAVFAIAFVSSWLLTFKAPRDIEKKQDKLASQIDEQSKKIDGQSEDIQYNIEILKAVNIAFDKKMTDAVRVEQLTEVIVKYPERPEAYMYRGAFRDEMYINNMLPSKGARIPDDGRELVELAISDYEKAIQLGVRDELFCFNALGVAYGRLRNHKKAVKYYTLAIEIDSHNARIYFNRGSSYFLIKKYSEAVEDFDESIRLGRKESYKVYKNRSGAYGGLFKSAANASERANFCNEQIADLKEAIRLAKKDGSIGNKVIKEMKDNLSELSKSKAS